MLCTIGDLVEDVVVWLNTELNIGSDTESVIRRTRGGSAANVSMFAYPDSKQKLVVVDFTQDFKSPHLSNKMQKRQYWLLEDGNWKIISEGAA